MIGHEKDVSFKKGPVQSWILSKNESSLRDSQDLKAMSLSCR